MNKYILFMLFLIPLSHAIEINVTLFCVAEDGDPCPSTTLCNATVRDIDFILVVNSTNMTFINDGFYNITIDQPIGRYNAFGTCTDLSGNIRSTDLSFQIGADMVFETASILGLSALSFILFFVANNMRNSNFQFLFLSSGLFSLILLMASLSNIAGLNSQNTLQTFMGLGLLLVGTITIVVMFFFFIKLIVIAFEKLKGLSKTGIEKETDEEKRRDKEFDM